MAAGAANYTKVEVMAVAVVMTMVAEEDLVEGAMVITHMNSPTGMDHSWKRPVYTLQTHVNSSL